MKRKRPKTAFSLLECFHSWAMQSASWIQDLRIKFTSPRNNCIIAFDKSFIMMTELIAPTRKLRSIHCQSVPMQHRKFSSKL